MEQILFRVAFDSSLSHTVIWDLSGDPTGGRVLSFLSSRRGGGGGWKGVGGAPIPTRAHTLCTVYMYFVEGHASARTIMNIFRIILYMNINIHEQRAKTVKLKNGLIKDGRTNSANMNKYG